MIVPIEVKGKPASAVVDSGAQVTIINSRFFDLLSCGSPTEPVVLKGIASDKNVEGYMVRQVPLTLGEDHTSGTYTLLPLKMKYC